MELKQHILPYLKIGIVKSVVPPHRRIKRKP